MDDLTSVVVEDDDIGGLGIVVKPLLDALPTFAVLLLLLPPLFVWGDVAATAMDAFGRRLLLLPPRAGLFPRAPIILALNSFAGLRVPDGTL